MPDVEFIDLFGEILGMSGTSSFFPGRTGPGPPEVVRTGHLVSVRPGHTRGHHYHPGHEEWLSFHGVGVLAWEIAAESGRGWFRDGTLIRIPPGSTMP